MSAFALTQIPNANVPPSVCGDELSLVWVDDHIVHRMCVLVMSLYQARSGIPDSDRHVLGTCHHPFALTVESHTGDIVGVTLEGHYRLRVAGFDVVEAYHVPAGRCEELFVWCDA